MFPLGHTLQALMSARSLSCIAANFKPNSYLTETHVPSALSYLIAMFQHGTKQTMGSSCKELLWMMKVQEHQRCNLQRRLSLHRTDSCESANMLICLCKREAWVMYPLPTSCVAARSTNSTARCQNILPSQHDVTHIF